MTESEATIPPESLAPDSSRSQRAGRLRIWFFVLLLLAILAAIAFLLFTPHGRELLNRDHLRQIGPHVRDSVDRHALLAPLTFVAVYVLLSVLVLPVWWLQILGGFGFGIVAGVFWSQIGSTLGAVLAFQCSRWIGADWFHKRIEGRMARLRELDEKLGHNGFFVVMAVRLSHFIPFGLSNYAFGLTTISAIDVAIGTFLGNIPAVTAYVTVGGNASLLTDWRYLLALGAINVLLLLPVVLRYLRPQWFRKIGVE